MSISILCVDDDPAILEIYRESFQDQYDVYLALGPKQALEKMELGPFYSVILTDAAMPEMDGIELMEIATKRFPGSVRVMLTGLANEAEPKAALEKGTIQHLIPKPFRLNVIKKVIDESVFLAWQRLRKVPAAA